MMTEIGNNIDFCGSQVKKKTSVKVTTSSAGGGNAGKKKNKSVRTSISMPTTDPGSDFFELSSDEELTDVDGEGNATRVRNRSKLRATEGYKKLVMYESQTTTQLVVPPELIITSARVLFFVFLDNFYIRLCIYVSILRSRISTL